MYTLMLLLKAHDMVIHYSCCYLYLVLINITDNYNIQQYSLIFLTFGLLLLLKDTRIKGTVYITMQQKCKNSSKRYAHYVICSDV